MQLIGELVGALFMSYFHSFNFTFLFYSETIQISRKKGGGGDRIGNMNHQITIFACLLPDHHFCFTQKCLCVKSRTMERQPPQRT